MNLKTGLMAMAFAISPMSHSTKALAQTAEHSTKPLIKNVSKLTKKAEKILMLFLMLVEGIEHIISLEKTFKSQVSELI
ncbi:MAG: hypothetical protein ACI4S3_08230 [Candidatus Gastranaerophilaceae bacterium]